MSFTMIGEQVDGFTVYGEMGGAGTVGSVAVGEIPAGLDRWLDATDNRTIVLAPNVNSWASKTGASQYNEAGGGQATLVAPGSGTLNGQQHISFTGVESYAEVAGLLSGQSGEVWIAYDFDVAAAGGQIFGTALGGGAQLVFYVQSVGNTPAMSGSLNGWVINDATWSPNTANFFRALSTGSAYGAEVNGAPHTIAFFLGSDNGAWFGDFATTFDIVGVLNGGQGLDGQLGEILVIKDRNLSGDELRSMNIYMGVKWRGVHP